MRPNDLIDTPAAGTSAGTAAGNRHLRQGWRAWIPWFAVAISLVGPVEADEVRFNRDVLPILSDHCFACHGPDAASREADLRLDREADAKNQRDDGFAIIQPGDSHRSEFVRRISSEDKDDVMPPSDSAKQLTEAQKRTLIQWINEGASWEKHWAYQTIPVPEKSFSLARVAVDHFVDQRLHAEKLNPNPVASPSTWLRRVTLDLTGLPPSLPEITAFQSDPDFEAVVERLLGSKSFGERMAWDWLEAARYADTHGYQKDNVRTMWAWRDWVIAAFNDNLPYNQFITDQLAGDLLPNATLSQRIATGFNRNHRINAEAGSIDEEFRTEYVIDRTDTMATVWMGMTAGCSRCHDHKFDPLSQREYYQLSAFFNNVQEKGRDGVATTAIPDLRVPLVGNDRNLEEARLALQRARTRLLELGKSAGDSFDDWLKQQHAIKQSSSYWLVCTPDQVQGTNQGSTFQTLADDSVLFGGSNPLNDIHDVRMQVACAVTINSLRLEAIADPRLTGGAFARSFAGDFMLSEFQFSVNGQSVHLNRAIANTQSSRNVAAMAIDGDPLTGWSAGSDGHDRAFAKFQLSEPLPLVPGDQLTVKLRYESREEQFMIGRFRISLGVGKTSEVELSSRRLTMLTKSDRKALRREFLETDPAFAEFRLIRDAARTAVDELVAGSSTRVMVMQEREGPVRVTHVLERGLYDHPGESVTADVPSFLGLSLPKTSAPNRLALARWLTHPDHPLTARVAVNRLWKQVFGTGLVKTANDFGFQGQRPSHPELLDWLAADFIHSGWDVKRLLKEIVLSRTYRRSGLVRPDLLQLDPENRLLARWSRRRLAAPMLRDQALFLSGLMTQQIGGPPVKPWQPDGLWQVVAGVNSNTTHYHCDTDDGLFRRSIYTFWKRGMPPPNMVIFDAANRETCSVGRVTTNSPLQALTSLNDPSFAIPAIVFADRVLQGSTISEEADRTIRERIRSMWVRTQAVPPNEQQLSVLLATAGQHLSFYQKNPDQARQRITPAAQWLEKSQDEVALAAYSEIAEVLLNLDSTLTNN